jgi:hypothetical protein
VEQPEAAVIPGTNHNQFGSLKLIPLSKSEPIIKTPAITDTVLFIVINLILFFVVIKVKASNELSIAANFFIVI